MSKTSKKERTMVSENMEITESDKPMNRRMILTCLFIVVLFLSMAAYIIYFMIHDRQNIIASPYNRRTENLSQQITRGSILSSDGEVLAETVTDKDGNETRSYPFHETFAQAVGYSVHGKSGLESSCNYDLLTSHTDIMTQFLNGITGQKNPGDNVVTTLDSRLQQAACDALGDYKGAIVAIEPSTGKIRAMVSKPDYDPNEINDIWSDIIDNESGSPLMNRCTQGLYPPGSTYKIITSFAYLSENLMSYHDFQYDCKGETVVDSVRIHCYENTEHGTESIEEAFANSCNTAFVTLGSTLNRENFIELNERLLFNKKIDSDVSISRSQFKITEKSDKSQLPQTVIGQGDTLITPMHNALIMCAIANDGILMRPTLIEKIESSSGDTVKNSHSKEILNMEDDRETISVIQDMLRLAVTDGTARCLDCDEYTAAGKTGTAENSKDKAHSWFVGYSNVDDPDLVVCVIAENTGAGSKYAAPIAKEVFDAYYELKNSRD